MLKKLRLQAPISLILSLVVFAEFPALNEVKKYYALCGGQQDRVDSIRPLN